MTTDAIAGGRIETPEYFPVEWETPEHGEIFWFWDQMHHPKPVTQATMSLGTGRPFSAGIAKADAALYMPLRTTLVRAFNYYLYMGGVPATDTPEETAARNERMMAVMMERSPRGLEMWENVYLPEVLTLNERLSEYPYDAASTTALAEFLDEVLVIRTRAWEIHFLALFPVMGPTLEFPRIYEETFGKPPNNEHLQMLQGFPNKSVEAGQALYDLAQEAKRTPEVAETIRQSRPENTLDALGGSKRARQFAEKLRAYIEEYGWRADNFELSNLSWREEPSPVIHNLKGYLRDDAVDPRREQAKAAVERERLVKEMLERAPDQAKRNELQMMVTIAQQYLPVQENHNFYIDQMNTVLLRLPLLELGRRLAAEGTLSEPDDIFYLLHEEMQAAALDATARWRFVTAERRAERERWAKVAPPQFLGTEPAEGSPRQGSFERFFGFGHEPSRDEGVITGHGASKGVITGRAKIVRTLAESDKLEPGDVLVCEMTMPSWTPLFSIVSAVVADSGGVLSHCAIVAREYGIPCVVGTRNGTQRLRDGQMLTVDGAAGTVRLEA